MPSEPPPVAVVASESMAAPVPVEKPATPPPIQERYPTAPTTFVPPPPRERQPAAPAAVQGAIDDVNRIIETLQGTLNDMEEVLETLELAERQKNADEQEIETLRRGLRQLHRPREDGPPPPRR
jgi:hypothetical protein